MFVLVENRLLAYLDDSLLLALVREVADGPNVATSVNRDLVLIHDWCSRW